MTITQADLKALEVKIISLKSQLTTLTWAAHIPLSLSDSYGSPMTPHDVAVLRSEVKSSEALLESI
jgi:hypothetical protein